MTSFLLKDLRIFDGEHTIDNGHVLVENGKIATVSETTIEYSGTTYSKPGHTVLPGLIDCHVHCDGANDIALPQSLRFGVTTVCDMHNEWDNILKLREQIKGGDCADLKTASFAATIDQGWPMPVVMAHTTDENREEVMAMIATWPKLDNEDDAKQYVRDRVSEKVDYVKLMHESGTVMGQEFRKPSLELQRAVIEEAHKYGLKAVAHATCLQDTVEILEAGADGLMHCFLDEPPSERVIAAYRKNNAHCNPTLCAMGSLTAEGKEMQEKFAHDPRVQAMIGKAEQERMCACMDFAKKAGATFTHAFETVRQLKAAGIEILCGSDAARPAVGTGYGLTVHQELSLFVNACGFSPKEALRSATSASAKRFGFVDRGQIKEGLRADLTLVEGDPTRDIDHTLDLRGVWSAGVLCSSYSKNF